MYTVKTPPPPYPKKYYIVSIKTLISGMHIL